MSAFLAVVVLFVFHLTRHGGEAPCGASFGVKGAAGDQYAHDLRPAPIHRHGRFTPFPLALAVCYHSNRKPIFRFEKFVGRNFLLVPIKKAGTSDHSLIVR